MRISAADLRAAGLQIAERIPDCATIEHTGLHYVFKGLTPGKDRTMAIDLEVEFTAPFEWVSLTATVEEKHGKCKRK